VQVGLGIATVVLVVPVPVAAAHQAAAIVLLTSAVWSLYEVTPMARRVPAGATLGRVSAF
jgi:cytochrome c oxidase assembly protein subunit 15